MTQSSHARAPQGAPDTSRKRRRQPAGWTAWVRPFCRANRAIEASLRLIDSTMRTVKRSERCAHRRPVRTSRNLQEVWAQLRAAHARLERAADQLAAMKECLVRVPDETGAVPHALAHTTELWREAKAWLDEAADGVVSLRQNVLAGLRTGTLIPEQPTQRRPRIVLAPRPAAMRAFLLLRQPRVVERIAPILRRRRRTPRPAAVRVPRRNLLGRAPPVF